MEFKSSLKNLSKAELEKLEDEIVAYCDTTDKEVSETKFDLSQESYREVADAIVYFLNKQTVAWQYTVGMITLYDFWSKDNETILFPILDTTLRNLGGLQFSGIDEWRKVVTINNYFNPLKDKYVEVGARIYEAAQKHNAVMEALKLENPIEVEDVEAE